MSVSRFFWGALLACSMTVYAGPGDVLWTRILPGQVSAGPVLHDGRIFAAGIDRTLTAIDESGELKWNRRIPGRTPLFLTVTASGLVLAVSEPGILSAHNTDGLFVWQMSSSSPTVCAPVNGRDGRIFLVFPTHINAITQTGTVLWRTNVPEKPTGRVGETGDGHLLVFLADGSILRVSPFGEVLERIVLPSLPLDIHPAPTGFIAGLENGQVVYCDVRPRRNNARDTEIIWTYTSRSKPVALSVNRNEVFILCSDGSFCSLHVTDGTELRVMNLGFGVATKPVLSFDYDKWICVLPGKAIALSVSGRKEWEISLASSLANPVISDSGVIFGATLQGGISGVRAETRIGREKKMLKAQSYGILTGKSRYWGVSASETKTLFAATHRDIDEGNVGIREVHYARRLSELLSNNTGDPFVSAPVASEDRSRSALLLGRLGSDEYRAVLVDQMYRNPDETLSVGLLLALAVSGPGVGNDEISAVRHVLRTSPLHTISVHLAACDALYTFARYAGGQRSVEASRILLEMTKEPYDGRVQSYALKILARILQ